MREDPLRVEVDFTLADEVPGMDLAVYITTSGGVRVIDQVLSDSEQPRLPAGDYTAQLPLPPVLNVGDFAVGVWFGTTHSQIIDEPSAATFSLHGSDRNRPDRVLVYDLPIRVLPLGHRPATDASVAETHVQ
jgi:ABC-2 type transport system ATP-binding protein/lipopolysaccharide transport system ATP-binding protein